jgi:hypothetical protein
MVKKVIFSEGAGLGVMRPTQVQDGDHEPGSHVISE